MSKSDIKNKVTVNGEEFSIDENSSEEKKKYFSHLLDLNRKISSFQFNLEQLIIGRNSVIDLFKSIES